MEEFNEIYRLYSKGIYKYLLYLTGNHHLAEDLLQETFYNAFKGISRFKGNSKISTWLYAIAKNTYLTELSKNKRMDTVLLDELDNHVIDSDMPDTIFESKDNIRAIIAAIKKFDENYKQVMVLRITSTLSFREIGEMLGKNENWARITFYRAKLKLKEEMEGEKNAEY